MLQTEHEFTLPLGYIDEDGMLHRDGHDAACDGGRTRSCRCKDPRVQKNPATSS